MVLFGRRGGLSELRLEKGKLCFGSYSLVRLRSSAVNRLWESLTGEKNDE